MTDPLYLLDANVCICLLEGQTPRLRARVEQFEPGQLVTSAISCGEVMIGAATRSATEAAMRFFAAFPVLPFDDRAALAYAALPFKRARFDRLIAAHALALGLALVTNDTDDFADVPALKTENWAL